jgi:hypothetical protein
MSACLELRYVRDDSRWALDAELRVGGVVTQRLGRIYLGAPGTDPVAAAVTDFAAAYETALKAGDKAGTNLAVAPGVTDALRHRVRPAAELLGTTLLPPALDPFLSALPAPRLEIVCDADLLHVPFEAAWWHGDFLGFRFAVSRRLITRHHGHRPRIEVTTPPRGAVVADPGNRLNRAGQGSSGTVVRQVLEELRDGWTDTVDRRLELPPASVRLGTDLSAPQLGALLSTHDLLVLLAHHEADRRDPATGELLPGRGVQLGPDCFFSGDDLLRALPTNGRAPWLLCWPCCNSGAGETWRRTWREAETHSTAGLADAALRLSVPNFIGTLFEVHAEFVAPLIGPLLAALDEGQGVAEALRRARCGLRGASPADPFHAGTLPGLAFLLLGEGASALLSAGGKRLDHNHPAPPAVHWCREPLGARECGQAIAPGEPGHATHRCDRHCRPDDPLAACAAGHSVPRSQLVACGHPGCHQTYCPHCRTHRFARCWRHASARGPLRHEAEGVPCADPHGLHPTELRTVGYDESGFTKALCPDCWAEHKRRLHAVLNAP